MEIKWPLQGYSTALFPFYYSKVPTRKWPIVLNQIKSFMFIQFRCMLKNYLRAEFNFTVTKGHKVLLWQWRGSKSWVLCWLFHPCKSANAPVVTAGSSWEVTRPSSSICWWWQLGTHLSLSTTNYSFDHSDFWDLKKENNFCKVKMKSKVGHKYLIYAF